MHDVIDIAELRAYLRETFPIATLEHIERLAAELCRAELAAQEMGGTMRFAVEAFESAGEA
jgi:hypothetical protein